MYLLEQDILRIINDKEESARFIDSIDLQITAEMAGVNTNKKLKELFKKEANIGFILDYVDPFMRGSYADLSYDQRREFLRIFFKLFNGKLIFKVREIAPHRETYLVYDRDAKHNKLNSSTRKTPTKLHFDMLNYGSWFIMVAIYQPKFIDYICKTYNCKFDTFDTDEKLKWLAKHILLGARSSANHVRYTLACNIRSVQFDYYVFFRFVDLLILIYGEDYLQEIIDDQIDRGSISKEKDIRDSRIANVARFTFMAQNNIQIE